VRPQVADQLISNEAFFETPVPIYALKIVKIVAREDHLQGKVVGLLDDRDIALAFRRAGVFVNVEINVVGQVPGLWGAILVDDHIR